MNKCFNILPTVNNSPNHCSYNVRSNKNCRSFITQFTKSKNSYKQHKKSLPTDVYRYYKEFNEYIDSFNERLTKFLSNNENSYLALYNEFVKMKEEEVLKLKKEVDEKVLEASNMIYGKEIKKYHIEITMLTAKLNSLTIFYNTLEQNYKRIKERNEQLEEDNKFLKYQHKNRAKEKCNTQLLLEQFYNNIIQLQSDIKDFDNVEIKCMKLTNILDKFKEIYNTSKEKPNITLESALNSISRFELTPRDNRKKRIMLKYCNNGRSISNSKQSPEESCIEKLKLRNKLLERHIKFLKSKMGSIIYKRKDLEEIFLDCLKNAKQEIYKRKLNINITKSIDPKPKDSLTKDIANSIMKLSSAFNNDYFQDFHELTADDKLNLMTFFVCNEKVMKHIYTLLFPRYDNKELAQVINPIFKDNKSNNKESRRSLSRLRLDNNSINSSIPQTDVPNSKKSIVPI